MAQVVTCQSVTANDWVGFKASPCGIFVGQSGTRTGFFPGTLVFPCQYHSATVPRSSIHQKHYTSIIVETESAVK
jgi:hypothetical protein